MNNSALDGARFRDRYQMYDEGARDAYRLKLKVKAFYSYGDALAHHATIVLCDDRKAYSIEIRGNGDQPRMFLRAKSTDWRPPVGEAVFKVSGVEFNVMYDHAV